MKKVLCFLVGLLIAACCYAQSEEWLSYDDGTKFDKVNFDMSTQVYDIAIKYTADDIRANGITAINAVKVYNEPAPPARSVFVKIWQGTDGATELVSKEYFPEYGWNTIDLDAACQVDASQDLWIGVRFSSIVAAHPHACMDGSLDYPGKSNWMRPINDGTPGAWTDELNQIGDWNIQFLAEIAPVVPPSESDIPIISSGHNENALFYHNGVIYAANWAEKPGLLHTYTQSGTDLLPAGDVEITGLPDMPGANNFYGFASDGQTIYAVNQTGYIYAIDPVTFSLKEAIELKPAIDPKLGGPVTIAYDAGRGGFWCSFLYWSNVIFIQKDGTITDLMLKGGQKNITGLAYDDVSDGGPYLWASIGNFSEDNYAKIGRWNLQTGELTEDIINVPDISDIPAADNYMGSIYLYRDIATGQHLLAGSLMSRFLLFAYNLHNTVDPQSPVGVSNFYLIPEANGGKMTNLMWTHPAETVDGNSLSDLSAINIYRDGRQVHTVNNPTAGGFGMWNDAVTEDKVYSYKVVAVNGAGEGVPVIRTAFVGLDVPDSVRNLKLEKENHIGKLTWEAPVGENGGATGSLTYTIVRRPDNVTVIENTTETNYTDESVSLLGMYSYTVTAKNARGESKPATSNAAPLGSVLPAPWTDTFNNPENLPMWTIINANEDVDTWTHNPLNRGGVMYCYASETDDWLISPAIALQSGEKYFLSWYHKSDFAPAAYTVGMGKGTTVESMTTMLCTYNALETTEFVKQTVEVTVTESGYYNFGWHSVNPHGESTFILIDDVSLTLSNTIDLSVETLSGTDETTVNTAGTFTVTVKNEGQAPVGGFTVELYVNGIKKDEKSDAEPLAAGATKDMLFSFTPDAEGLFLLKGVVTVPNDYNASNDTTAVHTLNVYPQGWEKTLIGDLANFEYSQLTPFNCLYEGNVAQTIYYEEEIGKPGMINALEYYYSSEPGDVVTDKPIRIYMAMTQENDLYEGWITQDTVLVYDGLLNLPDNRRDVLIPLQKPFLYTGGNLMIYTIGVGGQSYNQMTQFQYTSREQYRTRVFADHSASFDYTNPGRLLELTANISLLMNRSGASLEGIVTDSDQDPIAGATVEIAGQSRSTTTDADGKYRFAFVPVNSFCFVVAEKPGYQQQTQTKMTTDVDLVVDFRLTACESPTVKNLQAALTSPTAGKPGQVTLSWEQPDATESAAVSGYRVYVNHERKASLSADARGYTDEITQIGDYTYEVSAFWSSRCESATAVATVTLEAGTAITEYPFFEGFESGEIPASWTEKHLQNRLDWKVVPEVSYEDNSYTAYEGNYFAVLSDLDHYSTTTRLTTPMFDFSALPEPYLSFRHLQALWRFVDVDSLTVFYKNTPEGKWKQLAGYGDVIPAWKQEVLPLPEPSATYWIAFEGISKYGYGVMLDDIKVSDEEGAISSSPSTWGNPITVNIYPNPANDYLTVSGENITQVDVYNVLGEAVVALPFNGEKQRSIDVQQYKSGVYIVKVTDKNGDFVSRQIIIAHK
jgi:hypothetical protein